MAVFSWQHGVAAAAEAFGVGKHVVHYWRRKLTDLTFHPKLWGGFEYWYHQFIFGGQHYHVFLI